jgi:hypothetical protein
MGEERIVRRDDHPAPVQQMGGCADVDAPFTTSDGKTATVGQDVSLVA